MAMIGNKLKEPVTNRFNFRNGRILTFVTKNNCNGHLRSPLLEVLIGNGRCAGHAGSSQPHLCVMGTKQQPLQMGSM
jgi:hypothetical protein